MTKTSTLRRRILKQRGVELAKHTRRPITHDDLPAPYHKTRLMKYVELKYSNSLENLIFSGTIYQVGKALGIDPTTVSKWRKQLGEAAEALFWKQFEEVKQ